MTQPHFFDLMNKKEPAPSRPIFTITAPPAEPRTPPHYYRCAECLSIVCTREKLPRLTIAPYNGRLAAAFCACGNNWFEYLGQAGRNDRLTEPGKACPCDERCTGARGPNCECQCGGRNHGTHLLVDVLLDRGPIPVLKMKTEATSKFQRSQWMEAQLKCAARMQRQHGQAKIAAYKRREWPEGARTIRYQLEQIEKAKTMRSQSGRLATLAKIAPEF